MSDELVLRGGGTLLILIAVYMSFLFIRYGKMNRRSLIGHLVMFSVLFLEGILMFSLRFSSAVLFVTNGALYTAMMFAVLAQRSKS